MVIHGLQKLTLLDFPGHTACTVFLGGCDLRCPFCHNAEIIDGTARPVMTEGELCNFLRSRKGLLDGVAFTGGEPLLRKDLGEVMAQIRELGFQIKLDTNGTHPEHLQALLRRKLVDYVAMDIKNCPSRYSETVGVSGFDIGPVKESAALLLEGQTDYEFRTTVLSELHDETSFREIGEWIHGAERYFLQPFVDRDSVPFGGLHAPTDEALAVYADIMRPHVKTLGIRGRE